MNRNKILPRNAFNPITSQQATERGNLQVIKTGRTQAKQPIGQGLSFDQNN